MLVRMVYLRSGGHCNGIEAHESTDPPCVLPCDRTGG